MEPLCVTFRLSAPVIVQDTHPLNLDALLAWCLASSIEEVNGNEADAWEASEDLSDYLGKEASPADPGTWVWQASQLRLTPQSGTFWHSQVRRTNPEAFMAAKDDGVLDTRKNVINSGSGQERGYQLYIPYRCIERAEAWCVGDREGIFSLLKTLPGLGKQVRNGYGTIASVTVEPCEEARVLWRRRPLPEGIKGDPNVSYQPFIGSLRPPYWKPETKVLAYRPDQ